MTALLRFRRLFMLFALPQIAYIAVAILTEAKDLTSVENMAEIAVSGGICSAYIPGTIRFLLSDDPIEAGDWLGFGVVLTWTAGFLATLFSMVWRSHGEPMSWINSDVTTYIKFMYISGGLCHLLAPGALKQRIPAKRWIQFGIVIASAMFVSFVVAYAADIKIDWRTVVNVPSDLPVPEGR